MFQEPADGGVPGLMVGNRPLLLHRYYLVLLLEPADDPVNGSEEILFLHNCLVSPGSDEGSLVAYIGNIGS